MAAGSQLEKGIWALFVIAATIIRRTVAWEKGEVHILVIFQCPWFKLQAIEISSITSPIRFLRAVNIPAANDFGFW